MIGLCLHKNTHPIMECSLFWGAPGAQVGYLKINPFSIINVLTNSNQLKLEFISRHPFVFIPWLIFTKKVIPQLSKSGEAPILRQVVTWAVGKVVQASLCSVLSLGPLSYSFVLARSNHG